MIDLKNVTIRYGSKVVIDDVSINFEIGKIYGIVGLNGAGKTTMFNVLSGYRKPSDGVITFNQQPLSKQHTSMLETNNYYYPYLTGREYLEVFKTTNPDFKLEKYEKLFNLPLDDLIDSYSTGMKKKLSIMAILKKEREVYLFDEPFTGLDMESNKILEVVISMLNEKGKTIFISSHIINPLLTICHKMILLKDGKFIKEYGREEFGSIESDLFGDLGEKARKLLEEK